MCDAVPLVQLVSPYNLLTRETMRLATNLTGDVDDFADIQLCSSVAYDWLKICVFTGDRRALLQKAVHNKQS